MPRHAMPMEGTVVGEGHNTGEVTLTLESGKAIGKESTAWKLSSADKLCVHPV